MYCNFFAKLIPSVYLQIFSGFFPEPLKIWSAANNFKNKSCLINWNFIKISQAFKILQNYFQKSFFLLFSDLEFTLNMKHTTVGLYWHNNVNKSVTFKTILVTFGTLLED